MVIAVSTTIRPISAAVIIERAEFNFFGSPFDVIRLRLPQTRRKRAVLPASKRKAKTTFPNKTGIHLNVATPLTEHASIDIA